MFDTSISIIFIYSLVIASYEDYLINELNAEWRLYNFPLVIGAESLKLNIYNVLSSGSSNMKYSTLSVKHSVKEWS